MSRVATTGDRAAAPAGPLDGFVTALKDGAIVAKRNVIKIKRVPEIMIFVLMSPIMFVLLFAYVFGGSIDVGEASAAIDPSVYREWLIAGIFAQTVVFGATFTGAGLAEDMEKGIINRFKSLPMSRSAVLIGRTASDVIYNAMTLVVMSLTGLLVGWRIRGSLLDAVVAYALLIGLGYAFSWVMAWVGLLVPSVEVINNASFMVIMPITFVSNVFVDPTRLPGPLRAFAEWNPVSSVAEAARVLFANPPTAGPDASWAMRNPVVYTLIWIVLITAVFAPIAVRQYRHATAR